MGSISLPPASENALPAPDLSKVPPFQMSFSLHLSCESCVDSVRKAVLAVPGILSAEPSLESQTLTTNGNAAPSAILAAIQGTGRDAVVRGTGSSSSGTGQSAAVAILEDYDTDDYEASPVRGLARIVQVSAPGADGAADGLAPAQALSVVDITLSGLSPGRYKASFRSSGDISRGSQSVGSAWRDIAGRLDVGDDGKGSTVVVGSGWEVWEIVGRAFAVERIAGQTPQTDGDKQMVLGVIARSAGVWDNDKMVCSCSGKTVWEERVEQKGRGMV